MVGIAGLRNSGAEVLLEAIFGIRKITGGIVYIGNKPVKINSPYDAVKNGLSYISDNRQGEGIFNKFEVSKNITIGNLKRITHFFYLIKKRERHISKSYIDMLNIHPKNYKIRAGKLSNGNQKKMLIAKWLCSESRIFIINQPTAGIDIVSKVDIYNIINELLLNKCTVVMCSNDIEEIVGLCHRIYVMHEGRIVKEFRHDEADKEKIEYYTSGLGLE